VLALRPFAAGADVAGAGIAKRERRELPAEQGLPRLLCGAGGAFQEILDHGERAAAGVCHEHAAGGRVDGAAARALADADPRPLSTVRRPDHADGAGATAADVDAISGPRDRDSDRRPIDREDAGRLMGSQVDTSDGA